MTIRVPAVLLTLLFVPLPAAETGVELSGVMTAGGKTRLALTDTEKNVTTWVQPGDEFKGFTVARYDEKEEAVFLKKGGEETRIGLIAARTPDVPSTTPAAPPETQAAATAIRSNLQQLATAARQYQAQRNVSTVGYNDLVGPGKPIRELKPVAGENYSTLNFSPNVTGVSVTTADGMTVTLDIPMANTAGAASAVAASTSVPAPAAPTVNAAERPRAPAIATIEVLTPTGRQPASPSYTIQGGDTWQKISEVTGVPVLQLKQLNPAILEGSALPAGQTIRVR